MYIALCSNYKKFSPKKKSKFLGPIKDNSQTFSVVSRSRKDLLEGDPTEPQHVLVSHDDFVNYGIDFDDDYDYSQHLKTLEEFYTSTTLQEVPVRRIRLPAAAFANEPDVNVERFVSDISYYDNEVLDPEIEAALEGDPDVDADLEDDFVALATGVEDAEMEEMKRVDDYERSKSVVWAKFFDRDIDKDEEMEETDVSSKVKSTLKPLPEGTHLSYHQGVKEKQFEKMYEDFNKTAEDLYSESVYSGSSMVSKTLTYLASRDQIDFAKQKYIPESIKHEEKMKQKIIESSQNSDSDEEDPVEAWINADRREKLDCDVTSVRSSINPENIPSVIQVPIMDGTKSRRRKMNSELCSISEEDVSDFKIPKIVPARVKNESLDEKRARKKAVKDIQSQRRVEKKANKLNFRYVKSDVIYSTTE